MFRQATWILFPTLLIYWVPLKAQETRILVRNASASSEPAPLVDVKWYSLEFPFYSGAFVYRKEPNDLTWNLLHQAPVLPQLDVDTTGLADPELPFFIQAVKETRRSELDNAPFLVLNLLIKSFQSPLFSEILGISYRDSTAEWGKTYQYKVELSGGNTNRVLGISETIRVGEFEAVKPPGNFSAFQEGNQILLDWDVDPEAHYAANLYQSVNGGAWGRLNIRPLMFSESTDSSGVVSFASPKYVLDSLIVGASYQFRLAGIDFFGTESAVTESEEILFQDATAPPPPGDFQAKVDSMVVELSWQPVEVEDLKAYTVFRSPLSDGPYEAVYSDFLATEWSDSITRPGPYYYYVAAVDHSGNASASRRRFVEVQDVVPPLAPSGLTVESDTGRLWLQWNPNTESDLAGYLVYRVASDPRSPSLITLNAQPLQVTHLEQKFPIQTKNRFYYRVVAIDTSFNKSEPTDFVYGQLPDVIPPERPHIKRIRHVGDSLLIEWVPNADADLLGYHLYQKDTTNGTDATRKNAKLIPAHKRTRLVFAQPGSVQYYQLTAVDSAGNESEYSLPYFAQVGKAQEKTSPVLSLRIRSRKTGLNATWSDLAKSRASGKLKGYVVFVGKEETALAPETGLLSTTSVLLKDVSGWIQVRAYWDNGFQIRSNSLAIDSTSED